MSKIKAAFNQNISSLIIATFIAALFLVGCAVRTAYAAETRGLTVVAKDTATNQTGEVKLYNKSYVVIIGIDLYQNLPPDRQLSYAVKDAEGVSATLKKHFKFDRIATLYNQEATKERIMKLLTSELPRDMGPEDAVFLFWAGHGNQDSSADGEIGYLIPYDGSADEIYKNITMTEIRDTVSKKLPAKHVFYAFDACYSGLLTTRAVDTKSRRDLAYMKEITKERVRQVLTAGGKDQEVLDGGPKGHSVFTGRLIEVLEATGDFITANEIQSILKEKVFQDARARARAHNQTPNYGTLYGSGDFVFVPSTSEDRMLQFKAGGEEYQVKLDREKEHLLEQTQSLTNADSAIEVVNAYLSVNECDGRFKYVLEPERIKLIYEELNICKSWGKIVFRVLSKNETLNVKTGGWVTVEVQTMYDNRWSKAFMYYLNKTPNGYKIDWESSSGYNKISPAEFMVTNPTTPVMVRVFAKLTNEYYFDFRGAKNSMYSVFMNDIDGQVYGWGYIDKGSSIGKKIFSALKNGSVHEMVFDIKSLKNSERGDCFLIHDVVNVDSWLAKK